MSPWATRSWNVPHVPIRTNVVAPTRASSSIAIAVEGQPIPVDVQLMGTPLYLPVYVTYSRLVATSCASSHWEATTATRPGSPGSRTYGATSPGASFTWYCRLIGPCLPLPRRGWRAGRVLEFGADAEQSHGPIELQTFEGSAGPRGDGLGLGRRGV